MVGIGASAGGFEACQQLLRALPPDAALAVCHAPGSAPGTVPGSVPGSVPGTAGAEAPAPEAYSRYADLYDFAPVGYVTLNRAEIIQDINITGATRQIKARSPDVHVIALSMHESQTMAQAVHEAGADLYVTKNGRADELLGAIRRATAAA